MEYDGCAFELRTKLHLGTSDPGTSAFTSTVPVRTGDVFLVEQGGRSLLLAPRVELIDVGGRETVGDL